MKRKLSSDKPVCVANGIASSSTQIVVGRGNVKSRLMLVGEAPGASEEKLGKPFVGKSGKLLDNLLESIGFDVEEDVYICNVVKCRPPNNRKPTKAEINRHLPWLNQQIKAVDPYVIVTIGATALEVILGTKYKISQIRGTWQKLDAIDVMPIFHPAYLLRNPSKACGSPFELTRLDLSNVKRKLDRLKLSLDINLSAEKKISHP